MTGDDKKGVGPCNKCLVKPMCRNPCEEFVSYLRIRLPKRKVNNLNLEYIAKLVLDDWITLDFEHPEGWRWGI